MEKHSRSALIVGTSTAFITSFAGSALNLAIPSMGDYFSMGASSVGWLVTAYMICVAAFSVPFGKIADSTGRKRMLYIGTVSFGITSLLSVWATGPAFIIVTRALQGIGAAMIFATNMPLAISSCPGSQRGRVIGIVTTGTYAGLAAGPVLGGVLNSHFGWKSIFAFAAAVSAAALVISVTSLGEEQKEGNMEHFDAGGNISYIVMICCIVYGLTSLNSIRFSWIFILAGLAAGYIFVRTELKASNPVIDVRIFAHDIVYTLSNLTALFNYCATYALGYLVSIYLQVVNGYSSQTAGLVMIAQPLFMALLSAKMGRLSDKIAAYKLASGGMAVYAATLVFFIFIRRDTPVWMIAAALCIAGIGIALFSSPNTNVIMSRVDPSEFSVANSILSTMRTTGQSTGMAIVTIVVSATVGNVSLYEVPTEDLVKTMHIGFTIFAVLCAMGIFMSLQRKKIK